MNNMFFFILCNCRYFSCLASFCIFGKELHPLFLVQKSLENSYYTFRTKAYVQYSREVWGQLVFHEVKLFSDIIDFPEKKEALHSVYGARAFSY